MINLQIRMREVPFCNLCCGARFKYTKDEAAQFVKIGQDLIAAWKPERVADKWDGQPLCAFSEDGEIGTLVWLLEDVAELPAPVPGSEPTAVAWLYPDGSAITTIEAPASAEQIRNPDFSGGCEKLITLTDHRQYVTSVLSELERAKFFNAKMANLLEVWRTWLGASRDNCDTQGRELWDQITEMIACNFGSAQTTASTVNAGRSFAELINALDRFECEGEDYIKLADVRDVAAMSAPPARLATAQVHLVSCQETSTRSRLSEINE